jgi:predicted permease
VPAPHDRPGLRRLFRLQARSRADVHAEVDEELETIIAARVEALIANGMTPDDARREAARRLGADIDHVRDQLHHSAELRERRMRLRDYLDDLVHDVRFAARGLRRRPTFTAIAVLTLAIGIGATTAIFSAVNVLLVRPLPYTRPDELMKVSLAIPAGKSTAAREDMSWSYPKFAAFRSAQRSFSDLSLYTMTQLTITGDEPELIRGEQVGATYLRTLGVTPVRGRDFEPSVDDHAGAERRLIISDALWQRRYNADPSVVGRTISLDGKPFLIVGVTPPGFAGLTGRGELFIPITTRPATDLSEADSHEFYAVGRRYANITTSAAASASAALGTQIHEMFASSRMGNGWGVKARPLNDARVAPLVRRSLLVLFGAVGLVLLIACVNVANLLIGRASARRREIAVRLAIGAGRARLVRLLLTESLLLAAIGGVASVAVAWAATRALSAINPAVMIRASGLGGLGAVTFSSIAFDWSALAFTSATTLVVGLLFGVLPALHATRASLSEAIKGSSVNRHTFAGRRLLVVGEVALALVLLAGSGLMVRSLTKLLAIDSGFDARDMLTLRLTIPPGGVARDSMPLVYEQLIERVRAVPGVTQVAINNCAPLSGGCNGTRFERMDLGESDPARTSFGAVHWASPTWFETMRVPLKQGRMFATTDRAGAAKVVLINETAARAIFPDRPALGARISVGQGGFGDGAEVIGIVGNVRQSIDSAAKAEVYIPYAQSPRPGMILFVKTQGNPAARAADVRAAIRQVAPRFPVYDIQPMADRAAAATAQTRFNAILLGLFAATALSLAVVGIYGVMSLAVAARTREIGIRIALGADQRRVRRSIVGEGVVLVAIGATVGVVGALLSTRVLRNLLFDLEPSDPVTYAAILGLLGTAAVLASWVPARRASRVDPIVALRCE